MKKWEYLCKHSLTPYFNNEFNNLGEKGWELVQVVYSSNDYEFYAYYKRELKEN